MSLPTSELAPLRQLLTERLSEVDVRALCFDLGVDFEDLAGATRSDRLTSLLTYLNHRDRLPEFIQTLHRQRPDLAQLDLPRLSSPVGRSLSRERRAQLILLDKVRRAWIEGVLEPSLFQVARVELGLEERPEAVAHAWELQAQVGGGRRRALPMSMPIVDVFDLMGGELLILGAPGSGKTTMLLELARDLIRRAELDEAYPLPVVFHLSSWATKRQPLTQWLSEELNLRYDVPRHTAEAWVASDQILPLLDGLDEMLAVQRPACVDAINDYRRDHGLLPIAVCSRLAEYEDIPRRLKLQGALLIQPLTAEKVDRILADAGPRLAGVREAVAGDPALLELAQSPLMLSIMALAYPDEPSRELPTQGAPAQRRDRLLRTYVDRMFSRPGRSSDNRYTAEQTRQWLAWLAQAMLRQARPIFFLDRLQPDWLDNHRARLEYTCLDRLGWAALGALLMALAASFVQLPDPWLEAVSAVVGGSFIALFGGASETPPGLGDQRRPWWNVALGALTGGLIGMAAFYVFYDLLSAWGGNVGLLYGTVLSIVGALEAYVLGPPGLFPRRIAVVETVRWSWSAAGRALGWACLAALGAAFLLSLISQAQNLVLFTTLIGAVLAVVFGVIFTLMGGLSGRGVQATMKPNEGIHRSARVALLMALGAGTALGLAFSLLYFAGDQLLQRGALVGDAEGFLELFFAVGYGRGADLSFGLFFGLIAALGIGLAYGGYAVLSHLALRLVLWRHGDAPLRYVSFLDYATDRVFLRKVGGGYIFVHRYLMEYFATQDEGQHSV